ncbi:MAG: redox-regulated ATPase YchF [Dehalococcoidia bacterium]|nr:MAG: redox-regulated ATPase YchF [Dehalococcoidia bacterium]
MSLACGMVGLAGSGKTTIYNAITAAGVASFDGAEEHTAVVSVPDPRLDDLAAIYHPVKIVPAQMKMVDIPGLQAGAVEKTGRGSKLLAHIKDVDALLHVVKCFTPAGATIPDDTINPVGDVETIALEMMVADTKTLQNKLDRLSKKVKSGEKSAIQEYSDCEKVKKGLDEGTPARRQNLSEHEMTSIYECNLLSVKPVLYIANVATIEDAANPKIKALENFAQAEGSEVITVFGRDEADIAQLKPEERGEFLAELGLNESSMARLLGAAYRKLGLVTFFTVGPDEVRAWTCHQGDKAPVAAGKIHTDMEKGFICMEVTSYRDLLELGSEAAVLKAGKQRIEGKTYEVREGDVVVVRFNKG